MWLKRGESPRRSRLDIRQTARCQHLPVPGFSLPGFSLVEMLVVLVLIGLLAGLVAVNVSGYLVKGKREAAKAQIATFDQALESYHATQSSYPSNDQGLQALTRSTNEMPEPFIERIPKDPWGNPYQYNAPGRDGRPYEIISYGADGREGGEGQNADVKSWRIDKDQGQ